MQSYGRLYTALSKFKVRSITNINGNILTLNSTDNIYAESPYKPFLIQDNNITRIMSVISDTELEVEDSAGFINSCCYTPWSSRWVKKIGDKTTAIRPGDVVAGLDSDLFQVVAVHTYGVKTAVIGLWQLEESREPTSSHTALYTPTSKYHLLPDSDPDVDITNEFFNNILDNVNNKYTDDSLREDIWATPTNFTRNLFIDTSAGWFGDVQVLEQTNIPVANNAINYVEIDPSGHTVVNTVGWNAANLKVAKVTTANCIITDIEQVWVKPPKFFDTTTNMVFARIPVEDPTGTRTIFTLPDSEKYQTGKLAVYVNGVRELYITEISDTQFEVGLPAPHKFDDIFMDYIIKV